MKIFIKLLFSLILVTLVACLDPYDPKLTGENPQLVFDGTLTDEEGTQYFNLNYSAGYNSKESVNDKFVNAAKMWITDAKNLRTDLRDLGKGKFSTPEGFRAKVGNTYTLHISNEGSEYVSTAETMHYTPPIDKIYAEFQRTTGTKVIHKGVFNVFLDTKDPQTEGDYYRWTWKSYLRARFCEIWRQPGTPLVFTKPCCDDCWTINQCIGCINMASDKLVNGKTLARQNLTQFPYDYTSNINLSVKQMSLSKGAYDYWLSVDAQTNNSGGIFDTAPAAIKGNIKNITYASTPALGYFQVSSVTQKIVYVKRDNLNFDPYDPLEYPYIKTCAYCQESLYRTKIKPLGWVD
jgi:hypothetical protein